MMDTAGEVMPLLLGHNKGFRWWLSHRGGCRGCREASSQQPDAPQTLLRTFQPSTSRRDSNDEGSGRGRQDFEGSWNEICMRLTSYNLDFGSNEHFSWTLLVVPLANLPFHVSVRAWTAALPSKCSAGQASVPPDTFPHHRAEGLNYDVSVS